MTAVDVRAGEPALVRSQKQWCRPLAAVTAESHVGGKAVALRRLIRAGINVPDGFVLATDALVSQLDFVGADDSNAVERLRGGRLREDIRDHLLRAAEQMLANGAVVVRSSAIGEDGADDSFAGQLDSVLHVRTAEALERAVLDVWASLWSDRAVFYRRARGLERRGMGVIVQRQVDAVCAGVLFTTTTSGEILVEYAPGLADALVQGAADPTRVALDRATGRARVLATREARLEDKDLEALRRIAFDVEREFGTAQDVEWALGHDGTVAVVQSRPITAPVSIPAPAARRVAWSNANVNENFPRPISPLLYSIASAGYTHYFRNLAIAFGVSPRRVRAMEPAFQQIIGLHGARMYYNLTSIHSILRLAPFGSALTASFDTFVGADGSSVNADTVSSGRISQLVETAVITAKAARLFLDLDARVSRFEKTVDDFAARTSPAQLETMTLPELGRALADFIDIRCNHWLDASLADAASMLCYGALERLLKRVYPDAAVHTSLLKAIPDVVSGEPVLALWELSRLIRADAQLFAVFDASSARETLAVIRSDARFAEFRSAFERYVDDWGFRCSEELMLTSPSFQEEPAPLIEMLRAYALVDGASPREAMRSQALERERETRRVAESLTPVHAAMLEALLPRTHAAIRYRERARLKQALLYNRCRRIALAVGEQLARRGLTNHRDDVFYFTHQELIAIADGTLSANIGDIVRARAEEHTRHAAMSPPDAFTLDEGESWNGESSTDEIGVEPLRGTAACTGSSTGRATVLRDVTESAQLARGDILVTKQTDPGWGPVFFLISGLVIERGGMLSHGAIIAREFGIPCVVGVKRAMERIPTGSTITVNGNDGTICVHE
jgi:pyruvate,water dikinase